MARPRKAALTDDQKVQRKATKKAAADELAALQWGSRMPMDPDMRKGAFDVLRKAEQEVVQAKKWAEEEYDLPGARKRLTEVHGWHAAVLTFDRKMAGLTEGERARIWRQMQRRAIDAAWDAQGDLFDLEDLGRSEDTGPVFDETSAGEAQAAERTDDPGRARRRRRRSEEAPAPTEGIPLDQAEAVFEEANTRRKTRRQKREEPQEFASEDDTVVALPKRRGRPAMSDEEKAAAKARREEAKRLEKEAASETADRYVADQERRLGNGAVQATAEEESGPPPAPVEEDDEPTGKYAIL